MNSRVLVPAVVVIALWTAPQVSGQSPVIYPSKGQSAEQQNRDTSECQIWAQQNTGVNPASIAEAQTAEAPASGAKGERLRGAVRGAAAGAVVGKIANDKAGKGAGVGAAAGAMAGGARQRQAQKESGQKAEAQRQQASAEMTRYRKAFDACMEGRGYVVK